MDVSSSSTSKTDSSDWWLKAKVAFNLKKNLDRRKSVVEPSTTMTQSTESPTFSLPESSTNNQVQHTEEVSISHHTHDESSAPQILIEAESDPEPPSTVLVPIIEVDMTSGETKNAAVTASHNVVLEGKGEAFKRYQNARAIFERYNIPFDAHGWEMHPKSHVERVSKTPRMRVRYICHECRTTFGHDRTCLACAHERCKKCIRHPPKRKKSKLLKDPDVPIESDNLQVQHGVCHECQTPFEIGIVICENCQHEICERCLEESVAASQQQDPPALPTTINP